MLSIVCGFYITSYAQTWELQKEENGIKYGLVQVAGQWTIPR